jgi:TRAP transporter TAXI family solute receptor
MILRLVTLLLALCVVPAGALSQPPVITLLTEYPDGTYSVLARNIKQVCPHLDISIVETEGTLKNIAQLTTTGIIRGSRYAFVQSDVFNSLRLSSAKHLPVVLALYPEEMTVIVNKSAKIKTVRDLAGKKVAIGVRGSGTWVSANTLRQKLGVTWTALELSPVDSIIRLLTGEIDALVIVAGHPVKLFQELSETTKHRLTFIPITQQDVDTFWDIGKIQANTYPWQRAEVPTLATRSLLVAAADADTTSTSALVSCIKLNADALRKLGHPKWNQIPLTKTKTEPK